MRRIPVFLALVVFGVAVTADPAAARSIEEADHKALTEAASTWRNQDGSTMALTFTADPSNPGVYFLSGSYINNAAGYACQGTPYPLTGRYYANTLTASFNVVWSNAYADCQSVTGWTGYFSAGASAWQFTTDWNLAYQDASGNMKIESGSDRFTQTNTASYLSLKTVD